MAKHGDPYVSPIQVWLARIVAAAFVIFVFSLIALG